MSNFIERQKMERKYEAFKGRTLHEAGTRQADGRVKVDTNKLRRIIREEPEMAERLVMEKAQEAYDNPPALQLAILVAVAYEAEFNDDKLVKLVQKVAGDLTTELGIQDPSGNFETKIIGGRSSASRLDLSIPKKDVDDGASAKLTSVFRELEGKPEGARQLQGTVAIQFEGYEGDARPAFLIPAIRQYITALDAALPHFLYYLSPAAELKLPQMYAFSLLESSNFTPISGRYVYQGAMQAIAGVLSPRLTAVRAFCQRIGDEPAPIVEALLADFPSEVATLLQKG